MGEEQKIVMYEAENGLTKLSVASDSDTVWLTLGQMAK